MEVTPPVRVGTRVNARYWIGTLPPGSPMFSSFVPDGIWTSLGPSMSEFRGQQEIGAAGLLHWQLYVALKKPQRRSWLIAKIGGHWESTDSRKARDYVFKADTRVEGTQFQFGDVPIRRNVAADWEAVRRNAIAGDISSIPPDIFVRCYNQLSRIVLDHLTPVACVRTTRVFWGKTRTGKSRRAWEEAGLGAYPKDPNTKWWCGYRGHENIVIDEFRGKVDIGHMLRWLDRYPVSVETKGGARPLVAGNVWITSNLPPSKWYPDLDSDTLDALLARLEVTHFENPFQ